MAEFMFGPFALDTDTSRLTRDGVQVRLRPLAFHTLRVLLRHGGAVVGYDAMMSEAWQGTHVSRHTVDVTVGEVRKVLGEYGRWIVHRPKFGYALEIPRSDDLVRQGWHLWNQRTRASCVRAIDSFKRAISESPSDFRAFEGLSAAYLALAVFRDTASARGVSPVPRSTRAGRHAQRPAPGAPLQSRLRAVRVRTALCRSRGRVPEDARGQAGTCPTYVRLALLYAASGRYDEALALLGRGHQADPLLPTLAAADVLVRCWRRDFDDAVAVGRAGLELHPYLHVVRVNYAGHWSWPDGWKRRSRSIRRHLSSRQTCPGCARSRGRARPGWDGRATRGPSSRGSRRCAAPSTWTPTTWRSSGQHSVARRRPSPSWIEPWRRTRPGSTRCVWIPSWTHFAPMRDSAAC
jgi:DNA-binding winged helix-turn-helix (wHTH) protein